MLKIYAKIVILIVILMIVFGFGLPFLISAKSTELVGIGIFLSIVIIPIIIWLGVNIVKDSMKLLDETSDKKNK
jgi:hypothetical protein